MNHLGSLALLMALASSANAATVVSVGDGDTIRVADQGRRITIRMACIDAPETSQRPWGAQSSETLRSLVPVGSAVTLRMQTTDRYGRTVAELLNSRGNVNQLMVKRGQAFAYRKYLRQCDGAKYLQLESEAQHRGVGVWSVGSNGITRPWDYRRGRRTSFNSSGARRKYHCKDIGSWAKAQQLLIEGHRYLDGDGDGEACESLRR